MYIYICIYENIRLYIRNLFSYLFIYSFFIYQEDIRASPTCCIAEEHQCQPCINCGRYPGSLLPQLSTWALGTLPAASLSCCQGSFGKEHQSGGLAYPAGGFWTLHALNLQVWHVYVYNQNSRNIYRVLYTLYMYTLSCALYICICIYIV